MADAGHTLTVVCTDRGNHGSVELARFDWAPTDLRHDGVAVWDATTDVGGLAVKPTGDSARAVAGGTRSRMVQRADVERRVRSDGGSTFVLPACPRCRGIGGEIRDDRLETYWRTVRGTPLEGRLDISQRVAP